MTQSAPASKRNALVDFTAAACASAGACVVSNPMETVKTRLQLQGELMARGQAPLVYRNALHAFATIAREEGIGLRGLQQGLVAGMIYQVMMNGTRLALFGHVQRLLRANPQRDSQVGFFFKNLSAGALTGAVGASIGSPFFLVKARLQTQSSAHKLRTKGQEFHYTNMTDGLRTIFREEGVRGLWRGVDGAIPRVMVGSAVQLSVYNQCKHLVISAGLAEDTFVCHLAASMVTGLAVVTAMNPFDLVSTRLYCQDKSHGGGYTGPIDCLRKTVRAEGPAGLMKGWLAHYLRLGPHTAVTFLLWEQFKGVARRAGFE